MLVGPHGLPRPLEKVATDFVQRCGPPITRALAALPWNPLSHAITEYGDTHDESDHQADCIVVLGCGVQPDGTAGDALKARVQNAERLFREGRAPYILFTGGPDKAGHVEAEAARQQALADGLPADRLFTERHSRTTWENLTLAKPIMEANHWQSCLISTAPYHERRSMAMAHELGLQAYAAPAYMGPEWEDPQCVRLQTAREGVATLLFDASRFFN